MLHVRSDSFVPIPSRAFRLAPFRDVDADIVRLAPEDVDARFKGRRILVVEDEVIVALEIAMELEERGADVVGPAYSLDAAVAMARAGGIDAAVLDVDLQGEDVFPAAEVLMAAGVPFLFHTGHGQRADLKARFDGAVVCSKPTLSEDLAAALASLLG